jgi:hypothetical protein
MNGELQQNDARFTKIDNIIQVESAFADYHIAVLPYS